ncbi:MAG TPA: reverse transcriptase domain-containing protein [Oculatellaceae cyanobacterium]
MLDGIRCGADIGYTGPRDKPQLCRNLRSAAEHADAVRADIKNEVSLGRTAGPFASLPQPNLRCSPVGAVAKKDSNEYRRIHHLSWPRSGGSVNDDIVDSEVHYCRFDDAVTMMRRLGRGALFAKLDIKSAFRCVPVRPEDRHLLGFVWEGEYYADLVLPFGLRSSPGIWERYSSSAEWILRNEYGVKHVIHFVDYFLFGGRASTADCELSVRTALLVFEALGLPVNVKKLKLEGSPSANIVFLGILLDSNAMTASLDAQRLQQLRDLLESWAKRRSCMPHELQSLVGKLVFAARVVQPGRTFLRRMLDTLRAAPSHSRRIRLSKDFRADLEWWRQFLPRWNGVSVLLEEEWARGPDMQLYTDASALHGYGAYYCGHWFSMRWSEEEKSTAARVRSLSMPWCELYAVVRAAATWGDKWSGKRILFHCDNETVVQSVAAGWCRDAPMMHLIRTMHFIAAEHGFMFRIVHVAGTDNCVADALSRAQLDRFRLLRPEADRSPTIPLPLPIPRF